MRAEKQYLISEVETHLKKSDYVILANFTKVTVADVAELRKKLAAEKAEFHVVKNSSLRVAAKALGLPEFEAALTGPTAVDRRRKELRGRREGPEAVLQGQAEA
jgi:large subunit ribosomal protein L10